MEIVTVGCELFERGVCMCNKTLPLTCDVSSLPSSDRLPIVGLILSDLPFLLAGEASAFEVDGLRRGCRGTIKRPSHVISLW